MRRLRATDSRRRGFSLLEMVATAAITAALMASSMVVIRTSYAAWQAHESNLEPAMAADAVLRHIVRAIRQAESVVSITGPADTTGRLELRNTSGGDDYWEHTGTSDGVVVFNSPNAILAEGIDELSFTAYEADGVTATTVARDAHLIHCTAKVAMPLGGGTTRTLSCCGWIRSWTAP